MGALTKFDLWPGEICISLSSIKGTHILYQYLQFLFKFKIKELKNCFYSSVQQIRSFHVFPSHTSKGFGLYFLIFTCGSYFYPSFIADNAKVGSAIRSPFPTSTGPVTLLTLSFREFSLTVFSTHLFVVYPLQLVLQRLLGRSLSSTPCPTQQMWAQQANPDK